MQVFQLPESNKALLEATGLRDYQLFRCALGSNLHFLDFHIPYIVTFTRVLLSRLQYDNIC